MNPVYEYALFKLLQLYTYCTETYEWAREKAENAYNSMEMLVLNDTFTQIYYYDFYKMQRIVIRDNANIFMVLWLLFLKYVLEWDISRYTCIDDFFTPYSHSPHTGLFEVAYFSGKKTHRYYANSDYLFKDLVLYYLKKKPKHKYLFASMSDKYNITWFINEHLTSFHAINRLTLQDIVFVLLINKHVQPDVHGGYYLTLVEDDTLEEHTYKDNAEVILIRDE